MHLINLFLQRGYFFTGVFQKHTMLEIQYYNSILPMMPAYFPEISVNQAWIFFLFLYLVMENFS